MKRLIFALILALLTTAISAQSPNEAEQLFVDANYTAAKLVYAQLLQKDPRSPLYLYRYARCAQETGEYATAITYFNQAGEKYPLKYFYLGECYWHLQQIDEAIQAYQTYLTRSPETDRKEYINEQFRKAEQFKRYLNRVTEVTVIDSVDIPKADLLSAYRLSPEAGSLSCHNGLFSYTNQLGTRQITTEGNDSASLLMVQYSLIGGWAPAEPLSSIVNFTTQQNYPYFLSDGITLYYAAMDENGLGGWDIYVSQYNTANDRYTIPENIGLPFNSTANDYLYVLDETQGIGYWATDRYSAPDSVRVYTFESVTPTLWVPKTIPSEK